MENFLKAQTVKFRILMEKVYAKVEKRWNTACFNVSLHLAETSFSK